MPIDAPGRTISGAVDDRIAVNGTHLHCVSLGTSGSPVLLVHGRLVCLASAAGTFV